MSEPLEDVPRKRNLRRLTWSRAVEAHCDECIVSFSSTGPAASHAAAHRHIVDVTYVASFSFVPRERVDEL